MNIKLILLALPIFFCITCSAQEVKTERAKYGGLSFETKDQKILDQAKVGITYRYTFAINKKDGIVGSLTDTLMLATGETYSVFLNPLYKQLMRSQGNARFARARRTRSHQIEKDLNSIADLINENSDYTEDDPGDPVQIFKNRRTGEVSSVFNSYISNIRCDQVIEEIGDWEMTEETDSILGYLCYKSTINYGGRVYDAWFTFDIPINDGPWKLWGLPGMILKAEDRESLFEWIAIGIQNIDADIVLDDRDYEKATIQQFYDYVSKENGTLLVDFVNGGTMYHSEKQRGYTRVPHEIKAK